MKKASLIVVLLSLIYAASASEILVPSQYTRIQSAINAAGNGDTIIVEAGTYREYINFMGKAITVRNSNPENWLAIKNTIIDGDGLASCVVFNTGEGGNSVLEGFTLTNGAGTSVDYSYHNGKISGYTGGGIFCLNSSPTIRHCNITGNGLRKQAGTGRGGGGYTESTIHYGGGIALIGNCRTTIENCFVTNNQANSGSGIIIRSFTPEQAANLISNCTVANNCSDNPDPVYDIDCWDTSSLIYNTIIWDSGYPSLLIKDPSLVNYCCIQETYIYDDDYNELTSDPFNFTGTGGNISQNPLFAPPMGESTEANYHLQSTSPCINAGDPDFDYGSQTDIDGQPRLMAGRIDIGADETIPEITVTKPVGGEVWTIGSIHEIKWSTYNAGNVDIWLGQINRDNRNSTEINNKQSITMGTADTGSYTWQIPDSLIPDRYVIVVEPAIADPDIVCNPSGLFTIQPYSPGAVVEPKWQSLGGNYTRSGLSDNNGPELGCVKWKFETDGAVSTSVTIGFDNRIHIACEDGKLYTLDANGKPLWSYNTNSPLISAPSIGPDSTVYVGSQNGKLFAIDIDGNLRWTHDTDGFIFSSPAISQNSNVYVGSQDGTLYALDKDGSELWSFQTGGIQQLSGSIFASPAICSDGTIYIGGLYDPNLYALDPDDGSIKWTCRFDSRGWPFASPVIAADGTIYQTLLYEQNLYAINQHDGSIIWSVNLADHNSGFFDSDYSQISDYADGWSEPALGPDGTIYVSFDDPYLRAVSPNGQIKWVTHLESTGGFTLTVGSNGLIYAASDDGYLYVVDSSGSEISRFHSDNGLNYPVIADDGTIIVADSADNSFLIQYSKNTVWALTSQCTEEQTPVLYRAADMNKDGIVDFIDITLLAADWLNQE